MDTARLVLLVGSLLLASATVSWGGPAALGQETDPPAFRGGDEGQACGEWTTVDNGLHGPFTGLRGVAATAVDDVWGMGGGWGLRFDGIDWTQLLLPDVDQGFGWGTDSVGAAGSDHVWFGGLVATSPFYSDVLMVRWDGNDWDRTDTIHLREQTAWPFNPRNGSPQAIDAMSVDDVWAVGIASGFGAGGAETLGLAVHWDGFTWAEFDVPAVTNDVHWLTGVAAVAADDVWAVGWGRDITTSNRALIYHWDGNEWSLFPNPGQGIPQTELNAVVALAADDIWAAGSNVGDGLFLHWDGASWSLVDTPVAEGIYGIAALAPNDVWAVGWPQNWYYHWDGAGWTQVSNPDIPGGSSINRTGGMTSAGGCELWSVGGYFVGSENHALTERYISCECPAAQIFADGFESGDMSAWSEAVP